MHLPYFLLMFVCFAFTAFASFVFISEARDKYIKGYDSFAAYAMNILCILFVAFLGFTVTFCATITAVL